MSISRDIITNDILFKKFVTNDMKNYFYSKLKNEPPQYVKLKICELLKFIVISHHFFGDIPFDNEIDEVWHLWILQTIQYQELMDKLPAKRFIHHSSNDFKDNEVNVDSETQIHNEFSFLVSYVQNFGEFTYKVVKFWPMFNKLMKALKIDLPGVNQYLRDACQSNFS